MDISKQLLSSGTAHIASILVAVLLQHSGPGQPALSSPVAETSECSWYFITFTVGTTAGVALALWLHEQAVRWAGAAAHAAAQLQRQHSNESTQLLPARQSLPGGGAQMWLALAECGKYGDPPSATRWALQVCKLSFNFACLRCSEGSWCAKACKSGASQRSGSLCMGFRSPQQSCEAFMNECAMRSKLAGPALQSLSSHDFCMLGSPLPRHCGQKPRALCQLTSLCLHIRLQSATVPDKCHLCV